MAIKSLDQEIIEYNHAVHAIEDECTKRLVLATDVIETIDKKELENYTNHLRANLDGIRYAKTIEELALYEKSFNEVLDSLTFDTDLLGAHPCIINFRRISDMSHATFDESLIGTEANQSIIKPRLRWLNQSVDEYNGQAINLIEAFKVRIGLLKLQIEAIEAEGKEAEKKERLVKDIAKLEDGIVRMNLMIKEFQTALAFSREMINAKTRKELDKARAKLTQTLNHVQDNIDTKKEAQALTNVFVNVARANLNSLCQTRASYLPNNMKYGKLAVNFAWITAGAALLAVGLALTAPIAVLGLGIAGIVYGSIDLGKEIAKPIVKRALPILGRREPEKEETTGEKAKRILKKAVPITLSILALGAGIAALAFPPLGIPLAALGVGFAVAGIALFARKFYKERKARREMEEKHAKVQQRFLNQGVPQKEDKETLDKRELRATRTVSKTIVSPSKLKTDAKIELFLFSHQSALAHKENNHASPVNGNAKEAVEKNVVVNPSADKSSAKVIDNKVAEKKDEDEGDAPTPHNHR